MVYHGLTRVNIAFFSSNFFESAQFGDPQDHAELILAHQTFGAGTWHIMIVLRYDTSIQIYDENHVSIHIYYVNKCESSCIIIIDTKTNYPTCLRK